MNKLLLLIFTFLSLTSTAQNAALNCGSGRYVNDVFQNVTKTAGIVYGYNTTKDYGSNATYNNTLLFDFYEPAGDVATQRPLIILMFGGGFISGARGDMEPICIALAKKGYATATIDYRLVYPSFSNLFFVPNSAANLRDVVIKAAGDLKAAIRFFKRDAATTNTYKIDPTKIIVGGASAGSIAAMQAAYTDDVNEQPDAAPQYNDNGGIEGNTDLPAPDNLLPTYNASGIIGVINIAGGIADTSMVDANNPPIYSSQGTNDEIVPYDYGTVRYNNTNTAAVLYGSHLIQTRANNIGLLNQLLPIPGGDHASPGTEPYISQIIAQASAFLEPIVCSPVLPVVLNSFTVQTNKCAAVLRWQTATEQQSSHYDVEASFDGSRFNKIATLKSRNATNGSDYTFNAAGYTSGAWFRLKMTDKDGRSTYSPVKKFEPACGTFVRVFPNPAHNIATISGLMPGMTVQVLNAEGKTLLSRKVAAGNVEVPLASFSNGLYLVRVIDGLGKVVTNSKLIKN